MKNVDKADFKPFQKSELRRIGEKLGGLNGFESNRGDGFLYGPLWFKGQAVKINVDTGALEGVADGFTLPAADNINPQGHANLYVGDTGTGSVWSGSLTSRAKK